LYDTRNSQKFQGCILLLTEIFCKVRGWIGVTIGKTRHGHT
jgi:hypothetical protein